MISEKAILDELDQEWMKLILEALEMGLNKEEIREFLNNPARQTMGSQH